ncbi:MAG: ABC transporter permease [Fusobacteriota bacterium]
MGKKKEKEENAKKVPYKRSLKSDLKNQMWLHIFVLIGVVWMIIFNYIPMGGVIIAFKRYTIIDTIWGAPWVGLENFRDIFMDDMFIPVMKNTLGISLISLIVGFPLPIIFALMLNEISNIKFKKFAQTVSYLPHFLSWVVLGGMMINWLSEGGLFNEIMVNVGLIDVGKTWLADKSKFWGIAISSGLWKELGWNSIVYLAAIAGIDPGLYEAARVDGAGKLQQIWHITLPSIKGIIILFMVLSVSNILNVNWQQMLVLQNPLTLETSEVLDTYVYKMGLINGRFSFATAIGLFKAVIAFVLLMTTHKATDKLSDTSVL